MAAYMWCSMCLDWGWFSCSVVNTFHIFYTESESITNRFILLAVNLQKRKITIFRTAELQIRNVYAMCESKINIGTQYVYLLYGQLCLRRSTTLVQLLSLSCGKRKSRIYWLNESLGLQPWNSTLALNFAKKTASRGSVDFFIHSWIQHILSYKEVALRLHEDKCCAENMKRWRKMSVASV